MSTYTELALRALQQYDELAGRGGAPTNRKYLVHAMDTLGEELGLECTGETDGIDYSHNGDTCPIHEWLVDEDYYAVQPDERDA